MRNNIENNNHHNELYSIRLNEYVDGRLLEVQRQELEAHLSVCAECLREVENLRHTRGLLQELSKRTETAPRSFKLTESQARRLRPTPLYRFASIGAAIAAAILALFIALDVAGAFTITTTRTEALSYPDQLPTFGAISTIPCPTPGDSGSVCAAGDNGSPIIIYQPSPPTRTIIESIKDSNVVVIQVVLFIGTLMLAAFAFALRPRAPTRR
jgi:hypothetical protein